MTDQFTADVRARYLAFKQRHPAAAPSQQKQAVTAPTRKAAPAPNRIRPPVQSREYERKVRNCEHCHELFHPEGGSHRFCSKDACRDAAKASRHAKKVEADRQRHLRNRTWQPQILACPICEQEFTQVRKRQAVCSDPDCQRERDRRTARRYKKSQIQETKT